MPRSISEEGIKTIEKKIFALEAKATIGMLSQDTAEACIREIRTGLFDLMQIIRKETTVNDATVPEGPNAA